MTILTWHHASQKNYSKPSPKIKLPLSAKEAFSNQDNYNFFNSIITGDKGDLKYETKKIMKGLQIMHLLTPSGLHFSTIMIFLISIRKRLKYRWLKYLELILCLMTYIFLPGYESLRRVALLRSMFIANDLRPYFNKYQVFTLFFIWEFFWGTYQTNQISFCFSMIFLGTIILTKNISFIKLTLTFFFIQSLLSLILNNPNYWSNLIISPSITWLFTIFYPFIFLNTFFISKLNYSEWILELFSKMIMFSAEITLEVFLVSNLGVFFMILLFLNRKLSVLATVTLIYIYATGI